MTQRQELALEALTAFIHCYKTLDKLEQLLHPENDIFLAVSVLDVQVPLLLFTIAHWEQLGKDVGLDFNVPLSHLRKKTPQLKE